MFGGNGPGSSPVLEDISRGMLGVIGVWMAWRAIARGRSTQHGREGVAFGFMAGMVPCPLTLFIMSFAVLHQVVTVGVLLAVSMMLGIALSLGAVAVAAVVFRNQAARLLGRCPRLLQLSARSLEAIAGLVLLAVAIVELLR